MQRSITKSLLHAGFPGIVASLVLLPASAVTAASLALHGDGSHFVPLDVCIETMRQTGLDMDERYKETSQGGLAVNVPVNIVEC